MPEPPDHVEVELKFIAHDARPLVALEQSRRLGPADLGPPERRNETDRYLDTAGLALTAAGWACRLRQREDRWIVSLKGPPAGMGGDSEALHRRPEVEAPASDSLDPRSWAPSEARERTVGWARGEPLIERVRLDQQRTERRMHHEGRSLGVLSLDRVSILHRGRRLGSMLIVELELATSDPQSLDGLTAALNGTDGLHPDPLTKLERALEMVQMAGGTTHSD